MVSSGALSVPSPGPHYQAGIDMVTPWRLETCHTSHMTHTLPHVSCVRLIAPARYSSLSPDDLIMTPWEQSA